MKLAEVDLGLAKVNALSVFHLINSFCTNSNVTVNNLNTSLIKHCSTISKDWTLYSMSGIAWHHHFYTVYLIKLYIKFGTTFKFTF